MCGIAGYFGMEGLSAAEQLKFDDAVRSLRHRGPDTQRSLHRPHLSLGHARLSILDLDQRAHQPMVDQATGSVITFNGELYNYQALRNANRVYATTSDTEVLLNELIAEGAGCLPRLDGFFAFAFFNPANQQLLLAVDRFAKKPLYVWHSHNKMVFASEMRVVESLVDDLEIDRVSLFTYLKMSYVPAPHTMLKGVWRLEPGTMLEVHLSDDGLHVKRTRWHQWASVKNSLPTKSDYNQAVATTKELLRLAVEKRLVADVPVCTFLSGGIDSAIVSALAHQASPDVEAFTIGFPENPQYDETATARAAAKHLGIRHQVIEVRNEQLLEAGTAVIAHSDHPFADSSAINMYLLCEQVSKKARVALSGDGADEVFGGYRKHTAHFRATHRGPAEWAVGVLGPLLKVLPASRSGAWANRFRKLKKFAQALPLAERERYWLWAGLLSDEECNYLMADPLESRAQRLSDDGREYKKRKDALLAPFMNSVGMDAVLMTDVNMVLAGDMLVKVDSMSMAHSLEVRCPMLDVNLVEYAMRLPSLFKVNQHERKKVLRDAFADLLPSAVMNAPKRGFEVPLHSWFKGPMAAALKQECFDHHFLLHQKLFNPAALADLHARTGSNNPGDAPATAFAFLVFQSWYRQWRM